MNRYLVFFETRFKHFHDGSFCKRFSFRSNYGSFWKKKRNAFRTAGLDGRKHADINVEVGGDVYHRAISRWVICDGRSYLLFRLCCRASRSKMEDLVRTSGE